MGLVQVNRPVLQKLQHILQAGTIYGPYLNKGRFAKQPYWQWRVDNFEEIQYVVCRLWPWLSEPKRQQIIKCFTGYRAYCALPPMPMGPKKKGEPAK